MGAGDTTPGAPADVWSNLFHANINCTSPANSSTAASQAPNMEGRVGKSSRRRSRVSRRAPTTLLNTDTTNFRAMVQQFTGIPSAPYPATFPNDRFGVHQATVMPFGHQAHHLQQQQQYQTHQFQQHQQQQQQQYQQSQQQESMFDVNNSDVFLNLGGNLEVSDQGFFMDGMAGSSQSRAGGL